MNNRATKKQAANLIRRAVAAGFRREVHPLRIDPSARPFSTQVNLVDLGDMTRACRQVIVTFRRNSRSGRTSVRIVSTRFWAGSKSKLRAGLWDANFIIANR